MADYAIGDVQGCFDPLLRLLDHIHFNEHTDRLWFVGDLVNRGPQSLSVLRFIKQLPLAPRITLGNHDLHLLNQLFAENPKQHSDDTLSEILKAPDREALGHWLRQQTVVYHDPDLKVVMSHAGIAPSWDLAKAKALAQELEHTLAGTHYRTFLNHMYGNTPAHWSEDLVGIERLRIICNVFTRMRLCDPEGNLVLSYKGTIKNAPTNLIPWFAFPNRRHINADIIFGHWAALKGQCPHPNIYAVDTGCYWGGPLTALRLQDKQRFSVPGLQHD